MITEGAAQTMTANSSTLVGVCAARYAPAAAAAASVASSSSPEATALGSFARCIRVHIWPANRPAAARPSSVVRAPVSDVTVRDVTPLGKAVALSFNLKSPLARDFHLHVT